MPLNARIPRKGGSPSNSPRLAGHATPTTTNDAHVVETPFAHADVLVALAPFVGLSTFSRLTMLNTEARLALDRPSVWRDALAGEFGLRRAMLELLARLSSSVAGVPRRNLKPASSRSLEKLVFAMLDRHLLPVPRFDMQFLNRRLARLRNDREIRVVREQFSQSNSQATFSERGTSPDSANDRAREIQFASLEPLAQAVEAEHQRQMAGKQPPSEEVLTTDPFARDDAGHFLNILRASPSVGLEVTRDQMLAFLSATAFPACPLALFDSGRVASQLQTFTAVDIPVKMVDLAFRSWSLEDKSLLSALQTAGFKITDFAGPRDNDIRYIAKSRSAIDVWIGVRVKSVLQALLTPVSTSTTADQEGQTTTVSCQKSEAPTPGPQEGPKIAQALKSTQIIEFTQAYLRRFGVTFNRRALLADILPTVVSTAAALDPPSARQEFLSFWSWFASLEQASGVTNLTLGPEIKSDLFELHLKSLPKSWTGLSTSPTESLETPSSDLLSTELFWESDLLTPKEALEQLKRHISSFGGSSDESMGAGDRIATTFGRGRWDPKSEEYFAAAGTLDSKFACFLEIGKVLDNKCGSPGRFGQWVLKKCIGWDYLLGVVTCLKMGIKIDKQGVEKVWAKDIEKQQRLWQVIVRFSNPKTLQRLSRALSSTSRSRFDGRLPPLPGSPGFDSPASPATPTRPAPMLLRTPRNKTQSLPTSPYSQSAPAYEDSATLVADLVVHSLRVKFEAILHGAVTRSVRGFLEGQQSALLPDMRKLMVGVVGNGDGNFDYWQEGLAGEEDTSSGSEGEEETTAPATAVAPVDPEYEPAWFNGIIDF